MLKSETNQQADMGAITPVLHADFRKQKKRTLQFKLIVDYSHFHIFIYQNCLSLRGNDALRKDNAYGNVLSEKVKKEKCKIIYLSPSNTCGGKKYTQVKED